MKPIYRFDITQRTEEWHKLKELRMSASHATAIMANGAGLKTLIEELVTDYYSSENYEEFSSKPNNRHLDRGNEFEDKARMIYELETGNKVKQVGIVLLGDYVSCSPDGLVGEDGLLEIKCPANKEFMRLALTGKIDSNHRNQMQMQMYVTGRSRCWYLAFNPNFNPCYILKEVTADKNEFARISDGIKSGEKMIKEIKDITDNMFVKQERKNNEQ